MISSIELSKSIITFKTTYQVIVSLFKVTIDSTTSPINTAFVGVTEVIKKQTNKKQLIDLRSIPIQLRSIQIQNLRTTSEIWMGAL